jgi:hypothetical protein
MVCGTKEAEYTAGNCSRSWIAVIFFLSFYVISAILTINIFVAVISKEFEEGWSEQHEQEHLPPVSSQDIEDLAQAFSRLSTPGYHSVSAMSVATVINLADGNLGRHSAPVRGFELLEFLREMRIPCEKDGRVNYFPMALGLAQNAYMGRHTKLGRLHAESQARAGIEVTEETQGNTVGPSVDDISKSNEGLRAVLAMSKKMYPELKNMKKCVMTVDEYVAIVWIQRYQRRKSQRRKVLAGKTKTEMVATETGERKWSKVTSEPLLCNITLPSYGRRFTSTIIIIVTIIIIIINITTVTTLIVVTTRLGAEDLRRRGRGDGSLRSPSAGGQGSSPFAASIAKSG